MTTGDTGMKRIFITRLWETSTSDTEGIGTIRREGNRIFKWVKYSTGADNVVAARGQFCYYMKSTVASEGYEYNMVTSDLSDSDGVAAGQLQQTGAAAVTGADTVHYGWILVSGLSSYYSSTNVLTEGAPLAVTAGAVGNALTAVGTTDGTLDVSALVTDSICGTLLETAGAGQRILVSCPQ